MGTNVTVDTILIQGENLGYLISMHKSLLYFPTAEDVP